MAYDFSPNLTNSVCHSHVLLFIVDSISKTKLIAPSGGWCWPLFSYFFCKERIREIAFQRLNDSCRSLCSKRSGVVIDFMRISWERCKEYSHEVEQQLSEYCPECICKCVFEKYCHRSSASKYAFVFDKITYKHGKRIQGSCSSGEIEFRRYRFCFSFLIQFHYLVSLYWGMYLPIRIFWGNNF